MSIGTSVASQNAVKTNNLKLSNITAEQSSNDNSSTLLSILKFVGVAVVASIAAGLGQEWAAASLAEIGFSEFTVSTISTTFAASTEFGINQGYDALTNSTSKYTTLLNSLPFLAALSASAKGLKLSQILKNANKTGLFKDLDISSEEFKNLSKLGNTLEGNKIKIGKNIYDFFDGVTKPQSLALISTLTKKNALSQMYKNIRLGRDIVDADIKKFLKINDLLRNVSPNLFSKVEKQFYDEAYKILDDSKFNISDLRSDDFFDKIANTSKLTNGNKSAKLIWSLYSIRQAKIIENSFLTKLNKYWKKMNKIIKKVNPVEIFVEAAKTVIEVIMHQVEKGVEKIIEKVEKTKFYKISKNIFSKIKLINKLEIAGDIEKDASKLLIPVDSTWILGYKVKAMIDESYIVMIYFQNSKYQPRTFYWDKFEFNEWVANCLKHNAGEYYKAKLEMGYNLNFFGLSSIAKFMPPIIVSFIRDGIKTYRLYKKYTKQLHEFKEEGVAPTIQEDVISKSKRKLEVEILSILFLSPLAKKITRSIISKKSNSQILRVVTNHKVKKIRRKYGNKNFRKIR
ncbi:hypothetical protein [Spiroplasma endosymbiont of Aspidapion aeneum]|uniref:hypothetical protein n=1 Tax=Spiroplasma endosymbiont of Aspidapion aeneum TaxID=3066276 RepID=UPI00313AB588